MVSPYKILQLTRDLYPNHHHIIGVFTVEFDQIEITAEAGFFRVQTLRKPEQS